MDKFKSGDEAVHRIVYEELKPKLYVYFSKRVKNKHDVEDLITQTFIKVWRFKATIKTSDHLRNFVFEAAHDNVVDYYRVYNRQPSATPYIETKAAENLIDSQANPSLRIIEIERIKSLHTAIKLLKTEITALPFIYGIVVRRYALEHQTPAEIAKALNISVYTVQKHRAAARDNLIKRLTDTDFPRGLLKKKIFSYLINQLHRINI